MKKFITLYVVPRSYNYIQQYDFSNPTKIPFEKTDKIDYNTVTVIVINDSLFTRLAKFYVVYKGKIQTTGGGGSCYNPQVAEEKAIRGEKWEYITKGFSQLIPFNWEMIWKGVVQTKFDLVEKAVNPEGTYGILPMFIWNTKEYALGNYGMLVAKLDAIGMGLLSTESLPTYHHPRKKRLLLQAPKI